MTTVGEGLMIASSTAWMFKHISLEDWLNCSARNGTPALSAATSAPRDGEAWKALEDGLAGLLKGESMVHGQTDVIQVLDLMAGGHMPFPQLVERIDLRLCNKRVLESLIAAGACDSLGAHRKQLIEALESSVTTPRATTA